MEIDPPYSLLAELTHACPMRCAYCSNPLELQSQEKELTTSEWTRVIGEASEIGILQLHLSGGEPLIRHDLEEIVRAASNAGLYTNLITSGIALSDKRLKALKSAGLNSVQISVQDSNAAVMKQVTGIDALSIKLEACAVVKKSDLPLCVNVVLHRLNIERAEEMVRQAVNAGASRIELANVQYYGWAFLNRSYLIPSREQFGELKVAVSNVRRRYPGVEILLVLPDYYEEFPKPCMGGWGRLHLTVDPIGLVLPCPSARVIANLNCPTVHERSLKDIWFDSEAFNAFRGKSWMQEPCRTCERQDIDFGGCRCQAFIYTGDARATDPVCKFSDRRADIDRAVLGAQEASAPNLRSNLVVNPHTKPDQFRYRDRIHHAGGVSDCPQ